MNQVGGTDFGGEGQVELLIGDQQKILPTRFEQVAERFGATAMSGCEGRVEVLPLPMTVAMMRHAYEARGERQMANKRGNRIAA